MSTPRDPVPSGPPEPVGTQVPGARVGNDDIACPMSCNLCSEPGDCEDCLDCLFWPGTFDPVPPRRPTPRGRSSPLQQAELDRARAELSAGTRMGLLLRRFRAARQMGQRALARDVGIHHTTLGRAESDAGGLTLDKVESLLAHVDYRIAFVPGEQPVGSDVHEDADETWGTAELLARDGQGRRLPPHGMATWLSTDEVRIRSAHGPDEPRWMWQRPR